MKKVMQIAILGASLVIGASAALAGEYELSNGTNVSTPFAVENSKTAIVFGLTNRNVMKEHLSNKSLRVMKVPCQRHLGITALFAQNIIDSELGAYNELVSTMFVKKRGAPNLELPCLKGTDQLSVINFISESLGIMVAANSDNLAAGLPLDYGMYTQSLIVSTEDSQLAGLEVWGFPKTKGDISFSITGDTFAVDSNDIITGRPIFGFRTGRITSQPISPFGLNGDFFVPSKYTPDGKLSQLNGVLGTKDGTSAYLYPFMGDVSYGDVGVVTNDLARYLSDGGFAPALVVDFDHVVGAFNDNRIF